MKILAATLIALTLAAPLGHSAAADPADRTTAPRAYKETAVFNQVVAGSRFVGNFLAAPGRCDVTVFETRADDAALMRRPLRRYVLPIAAGSRGLLEATPQSALAITCAAKANEIKVAPQATPPDAVR